MLADYAAVSDGKLFLAGGGWRRAGSTAIICAIAGVLIVPWARLGSTIELKLALVAGDGKTVMIGTPDGPVAFVANASIVATKPATLPKGADASAPFVASFLRPELLPDSYAFTVSGAEDGEIARLPFEIVA